MLTLKHSIQCIYRRLSTTASCSALHSYKAVNEPIYGYEAGSKERAELDAKLKEYESKVHEAPIIIGGEEIRTEEVRYQVRPFDHQNKLTKYYHADKTLLQKAIDVSQEARPAWDRVPLEEKAEIFAKAGDLVAGKYRMDLMASTMLGQGKTIIQAEIDAACELADFYRFNVEYALDMVKWQPISTDISQNRLIYRGMEGFWAAVAPFNFTAISGHLAAAPAFMGNVVLWKPSNTAVLSSYIVMKILMEAGVPPGVVNFVPCTGPNFGEVTTASPHLAGINFTGSGGTFQHLWQKVGENVDNYRTFPRLIGECGGKNFHFVHKSADVASVVNGTIRSGFEYSGQKCSACSRIYVPESLWGQIKDGLLEAHKQIKLGSPVDADTFLTAVIDRKSFLNIKKYLDDAKASPNTTIIAGGNCDESKGYYIDPTIIECKDPQDILMNEELFGPVVSVYVYKDAEYKEAMKLVDSTSDFALTGAIYASDTNFLAEATDAFRHAAGNFYVNDKSTGSVVAQQPFGGSRKSGTNDKAGGPHYLLRFCSPQAIKTTSVPARDWRYPYMES